MVARAGLHRCLTRADEGEDLETTAAHAQAAVLAGRYRHAMQAMRLSLEDNSDAQASHLLIRMLRAFDQVTHMPRSA